MWGVGAGAGILVGGSFGGMDEEVVFGGGGGGGGAGCYW